MEGFIQIGKRKDNGYGSSGMIWVLVWMHVSQHRSFNTCKIITHGAYQ